MPRKTPRYRDNSIDPLGEFPLGAPEYFLYLLFQASELRDVVLARAMRPVGLSIAQWRALAIVRRIENCTMSALSRYSAIDRTTLTRAVDHLVARGLVERWTPTHDRRQVNLALTPQGEAVYDEAVAILKGSNALALRDLDPQRLREATRVLQALVANVADDEKLALDLLSFGRPKDV